VTLKIIKPTLLDACIYNSNKHMNWFCPRNDSMLLTGTKSETMYRTLMQFDLSLLPFCLTISNCTLNIYVSQNTFPDTAGVLGIFQILSKWDTKNVTWNDQPLISAPPVDSISVTNEDNAFLTFNVTTLVQDWYINRSANFGIMLKFLDESYGKFLAIPGRNYKNSQFWPYLELEIADLESSGNPSYHSPGHQPATDNTLLRASVPLDVQPPYSVVTQDSVQCTSPYNILLYDYSYLVVNTGANPAVAYLQVSPNTTYWQTESETKTINPGALVSFVPNTIAKYARLCYQSQQPSQSTSLTIYLQGRA